MIEPTAARGATPAQIEAVYRARYPELLPERLVGRDAGGHVVARYVVSRSRDFPDY